MEKPIALELIFVKLKAYKFKKLEKGKTRTDLKGSEGKNMLIDHMYNPNRCMNLIVSSRYHSKTLEKTMTSEGQF